MSGNQKEADAVIARLHHDFIAAIKKYERPIVCLRWRRRVRPSDWLSWDSQRSGCVTKLTRARENVRKRLSSGFHGQDLPASGCYGNVKIDRISSDPVHRAGRAPEGSANDANMGSVVVLDLGNIQCLDLLVTRVGHLLRRRKISPQLEAMHASGVVALRHLLVDDSSPRSHPLDVTGGDGASVPHAVAVLDGPGEDVCDRLDAAVGMPWKAGEIVLRNIIAEVIEEEKRIEVGGVVESKGSPQMHARAFERRFCFNESLNRPDGHR